MLKNKQYKVGLLTIALSMGLTGYNIDGDNGEQGVIGKSAVEIVQFHKNSTSAFAIHGASNQIEVISLVNLSTTKVGNPVADESLSSNAFTFPLSVVEKNSTGVETYAVRRC